MLRFGLFFPIFSVAIASCVVLAIADVNRTLWVIQLMAIFAAWLIASLFKVLRRWYSGPLPVVLILGVTLIGVAAPMFLDRPDPERWISIGPLSLYIAPVVLPSFLLACSACIHRAGASGRMVFIAIMGASVLLVLQPDASQTFALLTGASVAIARVRDRTPLATGALIMVALATVWAFTRPDSLESIPYVEGVFELTLDYSSLLGIAVIASALALIASLHLSSFRNKAGLSTVAAYYAVLYGCSVFGLTPAPLIGYGAGPWLGLGLALGVAGWLGSRDDV